MSYLSLASTRESIRYGFAVGKVRVLETRVFGRATYERLLDAGTFAEQRRILSDTVYGRYLEAANTPAEVEDALDDALDAFYGFLDEAGLPQSVVRFFRERYDFTNLKGALKARALGTSTEGLLVGMGSVPKEDFIGPLKDLPEPFGQVARTLSHPADEDARVAGRIPAGGSVSTQGGSGVPGSTGEPDLSEIDRVVDAAMYRRLAELARESRSGFLKALVAYMIDIANAKMLVRARLAGGSPSSIGAMLLPGGSVPTARLEDLAALPPMEAVASLGRLTPFAGLTASDFADPARLDVIADNLVARYLRLGRRVPVGPEPVIAYVLTRETEVAALRVLLLGSLLGMEPDLLRSRIRDLAV